MNDHNPFTPPTAAISQQSANNPGAAWKAIALGLLTDIGGTLAATIVYVFLYGIYLARTGLSAQDIEAILITPPLGSGHAVIGTAIGFLFSVLGGYVCARSAKKSEYKLALIMATLSALFVVVTGWNDDSVGMNILYIGLGYLGILLGAYLGQRKNRKNQSNQSENL